MKKEFQKGRMKDAFCLSGYFCTFFKVGVQWIQKGLIYVGQGILLPVITLLTSLAQLYVLSTIHIIF